MFDPKQTSCMTNCVVDTTPCPQPQITYGYPNYGLDGYDYDGYSYTTDSGFEKSLKKGTDGKYYIGDIINDWTQDGGPIPMYKAFKKQLKGIASLLFDEADLNKLNDYETNSNLSTAPLTFKSIGDINIARSADGHAFVWGEYSSDPVKTYVIRDELSPTDTLLIADGQGNPIDMNHPATKDLFVVNQTVSIKRNDPAVDGVNPDEIDCCSELIIRTIVAVGTQTFNGKTYTAITLEGGLNPGDVELLTYKGRNGFGGNQDNVGLNNPDLYPNGGVYPGDEVAILYTAFDPCKPITGSYQQYGWQMKKSNIQFIGNKFSYTYDQIIKGYTLGGVNALLGSELNAINRNMVDMVANTFYLGTNRDYGNTAGLPATTMGILTELWAVQASKPYLRVIRSGAAAKTPEELASVFLDMLNQVAMSPMNDGGVITCVMDDRALNTFLKLNKAFSKLCGISMQTNDIVNKNFEFPVINTPYGNMEKMTDEYFTRITGNSGSILFLNRKLIGMRTPGDLVVNFPTATATVDSPGFKIKDVTPLDIHHCKTWDIWTSFAIIFVGLEYQAHGLLEAFTI